MENRTSESEDQADELKKLVDDVEGEQEELNSPEQQKQPEQKPLQETSDEDRDKDVDILNLPPRRDVHSKSHQHTKFKISRASIRLLTVIAILVLLFGAAFYFWGEDLWSSIVNM